MQLFPCKTGLLIAAMLLPGAAMAQSATASSASASGVAAATPIGNPASWFPADAYPPEAKAKGIEGRTAFSLDVDDKGRVTGCNITSSSGSPLLDSTTCMLLVTNARFKPAENAQGRDVAGTWSSAMVWKLAGATGPAEEDTQFDRGLSPAEAYNQSLTQEKDAALAAKGDSDDQGGGGGGQ